MTSHSGVAGSFQAFFRKTDTTKNLGFTEEGYFIEDTQKGEIIRFEEFGDADIDYVNRGHQIYLDVILKEWNAAGLLDVVWPHSDTWGKEDCFGQMANASDEIEDTDSGQLILVARPCGRNRRANSARNRVAVRRIVRYLSRLYSHGPSNWAVLDAQRTAIRCSATYVSKGQFPRSDSGRIQISGSENLGRACDQG